MSDAVALSRFDAIVFDLGGVILPLFPNDTVHALTELLGFDASSLYTQFKQADFVDRYERGDATRSEFRTALKHAAGTSHSVEDSALASAWNAMLGHIPEENLTLLRRLKQTKRTFLLSNTNEIHIEQFLKDFEADHGAKGEPWETFFERAHYSYEMGMRKPEARIFQALLEQHQLNPSRTVFIDDNRENVSAAAALGFQAVFHPTNAPLPVRFIGEAGAL